VAKHIKLLGYEARHAEDYEPEKLAEKLAEKDRQWDLIDYDSKDSLGIGLRLRETLWKKWMPAADLLLSRVANFEAPATTRAKARGDFIGAFSGHNGTNVNWQYVSYGKQTIPLDNLYAPQYPKLTKLIRQAAAREPSAATAQAG
jgi:hypothetical protein